MEIRKLKLRVTAENAQKPLNEALADWLTEALGRAVSKAKARKLVMAGVVYLNRRRVTSPSHALTAGMSIDVSLDLPKLFGDSTSKDRAFELKATSILFEDEDLIVVDKPAGLPVHPTQDESRDNLFNAVRRFLSKREGTAQPYLGIHQRLDRDTSGIVLFTKTGRVNAALSKSFEEHAVTKIYNALTSPSSSDLQKQQWSIRNHIGKVISKSKRAKYGEVRSGGQVAETAFRVLEKHARGVWIEAIPKTGRTHQIRVHLSEYGLPILGDDLYGTLPHGEAPRLMLHAVQLAFPHPVTMKELVVQSPLPDDFRRCLREIR